MRRGAEEPSWGATWSPYSPPWSDSQAIDRPSGDQAGERSWAPGERVRLRSSPFSRGRVTTSPRNSNATRAPDGDRLASRTHLAPLAQRGRVSTGSAGTASFRRCAVPARTSKRCSQPACS